MCVIDLRPAQELYRLSNETLGYDFDASAFAGGMYLFEETFEFWKTKNNYANNGMGSAHWDYIYNGEQPRRSAGSLSCFSSSPSPACSEKVLPTEVRAPLDM